MTDNWIQYTPNWNVQRGLPELANGRLEGSYRLGDEGLEVRVLLAPGTVTTFGTGGMTVSLPLTAATELAAWAAQRFKAAGPEDWLAEAEQLLAAEPQPGDRLDQVQTRHARAQHLLLKAQLAMLRRQR